MLLCMLCTCLAFVIVLLCLSLIIDSVGCGGREGEERITGVEVVGPGLQSQVLNNLGHVWSSA